jgi:hypothetical protein
LKRCGTVPGVGGYHGYGMERRRGRGELSTANRSSTVLREYKHVHILSVYRVIIPNTLHRIRAHEGGGLIHGSIHELGGELPFQAVLVLGGCFLVTILGSSPKGHLVPGCRVGAREENGQPSSIGQRLSSRSG